MQESCRRLLPQYSRCGKVLCCTTKVPRAPDGRHVPPEDVIAAHRECIPLLHLIHELGSDPPDTRHNPGSTL
ncbi:unnamed protein product [Echinostoma caproni]|uniref:Uncharacterized protein n=1 Tax=Echinostoma caproni TaxID=27848 RepID=A0A183B7Q7_9TREM|nr:unnamed protein product [Echinostoma caproni]